MTNPIEILVPDIGGFNDVNVTDVLVKNGQQIEKETPLITIETEKAAMDVPAPTAGRISQVKLKPGDKVSEGTLILLLEPQAAAEPAAPQTGAAPEAAVAPQVKAAAGAQPPAPQAPRATPPPSAPAARRHRHPRERPKRRRLPLLPRRRPVPALPRQLMSRLFPEPMPVPQCVNSRASSAPTWARSREPASKAASRRTT